MEDSRSFYILVFALFMTFVVSAAACIGISTSESNENRELIDSLGREILILKQAVDPDICVIEVEHHLYLVFSGNHKGGIIHAEHCPCKMK